jgi:hypothetical protein
MVLIHHNFSNGNNGYLSIYCTGISWYGFFEPNNQYDKIMITDHNSMESLLTEYKYYLDSNGLAVTGETIFNETIMENYMTFNAFCVK